MTRFKTLIALFFVAALVVGLAGPAAAAPTQEDDWWLQVNSPGSYCGYSNAIINNYNNGGNGFFTGLTEVVKSNPCNHSTGTPVLLPAGWLKVQVSLRCLDSGTEWEEWNSGVIPNGANTAGISAGLSTGWTALCGLTFQARVVVTSWFYIYPTGWTSAAHTTHWVSNI